MLVSILSLDLSSTLLNCGVIFVLTIGIRAGHLSYWCDPEGEDVHDCSMQKTIMLKDGQYGHWKVRMKLLVRGINDAAWIAVKTRQEEPSIFTAEGKKPKPKEPRQGVVREIVQEVVRRMRQSLMQYT